MHLVDVKKHELRPVFEPLLREWAEVITGYSAAHRDDALYWYNEQASVSTVAAAAARMRWHVLAEFRTEKDEGQGRFLGRADLWFESPVATDSQHSFFIEAKQLWPRLPAALSGLKYEVERCLHQALTEVAAVTDAEGRRIGLVFVVPAIASAYHQDDPLHVEEQVRELIAVLQTLEVDAWAYAGSPSECSPINKAGYRYPGVACLLKYLRSP